MIQRQIFDKILTNYIDSTKAVEAISEVLYLDKSNVYRRISGEVSLRLDEIELLAKKFNLYLDELIYKDSEYILGLVIGSQKNSNNNFQAYILSQLKRNDGIPDVKMYHASPDWFMTFYLRYIDLYLFKVSQWKRLIWNPSQHTMYNREAHTKEEKAYLSKLNYYFQRKPTVFFVCKNTADLFLEQLKYAYEMNQISKEDTSYLLEQYEQLINEFEQCAVIGKMSLNQHGKPFEVFLVPTPILGGITLFSSQSLSYVTVTFNAPNFIESEDEKMVNYIEQYFKQLKNRSTKISQTGETIRRKLFIHYRNRVMELRRQLLLV